MFYSNPRFVGTIELSEFLQIFFALTFLLFSYFLLTFEGLMTLKNKQAIFYTPEVFES